MENKMHISLKKYWKAPSFALMLGLSAAEAHSATVTLSFGHKAGNYSPYTESGYNTLENADGTGAVSLDNSNNECPLKDPACLHISGKNPGTAFIKRQNGTNFDAFSLLINFSGEGNRNFVEFDNGVSTISLALGNSYTGGVFDAFTHTLFTGAISFKDNYFIDLAALAVADGKTSSFFKNISELSIETAGGAANVRVDNVVVSAVPVPAAGIMLLFGLGALGALALRRRGAIL